MFSKLISLEAERIGAIDFHAFAVETASCKAAFAIFMNTFQTPLICYRLDEHNKVKYNIDDEQFLWIVNKSQVAAEDRKGNFDLFFAFVARVEQQAFKYFFRHAEENFLCATKVLNAYGKHYIAGKTVLSKTES